MLLHLAYLDPGTGAIVFQAIIGGVLAATFTVKLWLGRVKLFFAGLLGRGKAHDPTDEDPTE